MYWAIRSEASILPEKEVFMKELLLTNGLIVLLDDEDYETIPKTGWYTHSLGNSRTDYVNHDTYGKLHRYVLKLTNPLEIVDHIDRNGLNNQKKNLRVVDTSQNKRNQDTVKSNKFNFNGISFEAARNGRKPRFRVRYSTNERDFRYAGGRFLQKSKSFTILNPAELEVRLKEAILYRISKMREFGYSIDERSTTIEKVILEDPQADIQILLGINLSKLLK